MKIQSIKKRSLIARIAHSLLAALIMINCSVALLYDTDSEYVENVDVHADAFADALAGFLEWTPTEEDLFSWSSVICAFRTDGFCDGAIAGVMGNMKAEAGGTVYAIEGFSGKKTQEGVTYAGFETGNEYTYSKDTYPSSVSGGGHGLVQWSNSRAIALYNFGQTCEYPTVTVSHLNIRTGKEAPVNEYHTCKIPNVSGQLAFALEEMHTSEAGTKTAVKDMTDPASAAIKFHDKYERSSDTSEMKARRGKYAVLALPAVQACTGVVGEAGKWGSGSTTDASNDSNQLLLRDMVSFGYWDESQFVQFAGLIDCDIPFAVITDLSANDLMIMTDWKNSIAARKRDEASRIPRAVFMFVGIFVVIWSTMLYVAHLFDRINNFFEGSLLKIISFGKLMPSPDETTNSFNNANAGTKAVTHKQIVMVSLSGIALGILLLSGKIYLLVMYVYSLLQGLA